MPGVVQVRLLAGGHRFGIEHQACAPSCSSVDLLAAGEDLVTAVLLVPLGERGRHVHLLDDVPPADARVVGAEADLPFLRRVRNDAALGAAEVVVEQVLEPHPGDEQEVPAVRRGASRCPSMRALGRDLAVVLWPVAPNVLSNFFIRSVSLKCVGALNGS